MNEKMTTLILGSGGLIGSKLAHNLEKLGHNIWRADLKSLPFDQSLVVDIVNKNALQAAVDRLNPSLIVNCVNVATIFSDNPEKNYRKLIAFYLDLYRILAARKQPVRYIQIGTTGSGGLGFNIPFTHGQHLEDLPIVNKAAFAGIGTSMLTLLSRSLPDGYSISEVKPGLAVFSDELTLTTDEDGLLVTLDGGESGHYTYQEMRLLTAFMGFTIAEHIAQKVIALTTGTQGNNIMPDHDITAALNGTIVRESSHDKEKYRQLINDMQARTKDCHIVATGSLGPPSVTCDLIVADIICAKKECKSEQDWQRLTADSQRYLATIRYLTKTNEALAAYVAKEANHDRYLELLKFFDNEAEGWQIVEKKLRLLA